MKFDSKKIISILNRNLLSPQFLQEAERFLNQVDSVKCFFNAEEIRDYNRKIKKVNSYSKGDSKNIASITIKFKKARTLNYRTLCWDE